MSFPRRSFGSQDTHRAAETLHSCDVRRANGITGIHGLEPREEVFTCVGHCPSVGLAGNGVVLHEIGMAQGQDGGPDLGRPRIRTNLDSGSADQSPLRGVTSEQNR